MNSNVADNLNNKWLSWKILIDLVHSKYDDFVKFYVKSFFSSFYYLCVKISDIDLWPVVIKRCKLNKKACRKQRLLDTKYKDLRTNLCLQEKNCLLIFLQRANCERIFESNFLDIVAEIKRKKPPENRDLSREKSRAIGTLHY